MMMAPIHEALQPDSQNNTAQPLQSNENRSPVCGDMAVSHVAVSHIAVSHVAVSHIAVSHIAVSHVAVSHFHAPYCRCTVHRC